MRDENGVGSGFGPRAEQFSKGLRAAIILIRGYDKTALREVRCLFDVLKAGKHRGLICTIVFARVDRAHRNASLAQSDPKLLGENLALIVEIPLGRDVIEIERIGVSLISKGRAMADNDDETASPQRLRDLLVVSSAAQPS